jgi:hypothetical protein
MKFANVREMHQPSAVGKTLSASIDTAKKALYITAKVVDPIAWEKVKEGVYNGFSIGGRVLKRIGNVIHELSLSEISLVDRPANPDAVFALYKADMPAPVEEEKEKQVDKDRHAIMLASEILELARSVCYLYEYYEMKEKDTSKLEVAISLLTDLASEALSTEDRSKFDSIMDLTKKKLTSKERNKIPKSSFAYVDSKGGTHLPIQDEAHVRNAIARFGQTHFESAEAKAKAARRIIAAANKYGIKVADDAAVRQAAKSFNGLKPDAWTNSYFADIKQLLK